jgi:hypothetical protein
MQGARALEAAACELIESQPIHGNENRPLQKKEIRKTLHQNEWWFVISDVVAALTDSVNPSGYLKDMRRRDEGLAEAFKGGANCHPPLASKWKPPA